MSTKDRICPECGADTYFAANFERVRDRGYQVQREYEREAAAHAVTRARQRVEEIERRERQDWARGKVRRQARRIAELEAQVRELRGKPPRTHLTVQDWAETS